MELLGATFEGAPRCCSRLFGVIVAVDVLQEVDTAQAIWLGNNFVSWCIMGGTAAWREVLQALLRPLMRKSKKRGVYPRKMIKGSQ